MGGDRSHELPVYCAIGHPPGDLSVHRKMCVFDLTGATCDPDPVDICQCVYNTTADNVQFVVNGTADPDLYNALIRARWPHNNRTTVYSNKNYTVPGPEDVLNTTVEPTTDGNTATADEDTTSTSPEPPKPPPGDNITLIVCLSVIIPIVVIAIVIGIVWYFKAKSNQSKAVSNNGTDMTAKADENEQPKPDRKHSEHTNHASEESSTSPSNVTIEEVKATPSDNLQQNNSDKKDANNSHVKDNTNGGSAIQTMSIITSKSHQHP